MIGKKTKKINQNKCSFALIFSLIFYSQKVQDIFCFFHDIKNNIFLYENSQKKKINFDTIFD